MRLEIDRHYLNDFVAKKAVGLVRRDREICAYVFSV